MKSASQRAHAPTVIMEAEVARQIRQHGRSSLKNEVCGVLIGREQGHTTFVEACIEGINAAQGGAHVTFTQETWEHIYRVKDERYPEERLVGWYHSHPGFGVFLSDHDLFIQENFFSSPQQIAWVYDPHSDEEGCFGWKAGKIEKLDDVRFSFAVSVGEVREDIEESAAAPPPRRTAGKGWFDYTITVLSYVATFLAGAAALFWYLEPAVVPRSVAEQFAKQAYEEGLKQSVIRDCGRLLGLPPLPPPSADSKEIPNAPKR